MPWPRARAVVKQVRNKCEGTLSAFSIVLVPDGEQIPAAAAASHQATASKFRRLIARYMLCTCTSRSTTGSMSRNASTCRLYIVILHVDLDLVAGWRFFARHYTGSLGSCLCVEI